MNADTRWPLIVVLAIGLSSCKRQQKVDTEIAATPQPITSSLSTTAIDEQSSKIVKTPPAKALDNEVTPAHRNATIKPRAPKAIYPKALWGTWRLGPEPCQLPVNPDGDGRLHITSVRIVGYETYYEPILVLVESSVANKWRIRSKENYLVSQVTEEAQTFEVKNNNLTIKGDGYEEKYVKCM